MACEAFGNTWEVIFAIVLSRDPSSNKIVEEGRLWNLGFCQYENEMQVMQIMLDKNCMVL